MTGTEDELQRIAHLNEIVVSDWPSGQDYSYKIRLEIRSLFSPDVFVKELHPRTVPAWMINIQQDPQSQIELILSYRAAGSQDPWSEAGRATLTLTEALEANPSAANVTLPVSTWAEAPKLKLRVRMLSSLFLERTRGLRQLPHIHSTRPEGFIDLQHRLARDAEEIRIPAAVELTAPEEVIIKDSWNKLLAWKELAVPMLYRRLTHLSPRLGEVLEPVAEGMAEQLFGLLDLTVRSLQPHTEHVQREAYRGVHPSPEFPCDTVEKYGRLFADMGMRAEDWRHFQDALIWVLPSVPYFEDYELKNLELGNDSAWYRFLEGSVRRPMLEALRDHDGALSEERLQTLKQAWESSPNRRDVGLEMFRDLLTKSPELLPRFARVDIDKLAQESFATLDSSAAAINDWGRLARSGTGWSTEAFFQSPVEPARSALKSSLQSEAPWLSPELEEAWNEVASRSKTVWQQAVRRDHRLLRKGSEYVEKVGTEFGWDRRDIQGRWQEIAEEIAATGAYTHTYEEMGYGAQMAWRNASKCVGRLAWKQLMVRDLRHVNHPDDIFEELKEHLRAANNGGKVNPTLTMFRPMRPGEAWGPRIWNPQLIRYAAYRLSDGKVMGDPANLSLTEAIMNLGWTPPHPRSPWDVLPLVIEVPGMQPSLYEIPEDLVLEVHVKHPRYEQFAHMGLRWYVIPAISNFRLEIGGISYACCPFNGWYLVTEVARDFCDETRYDKLEEVAQALNLDTSSLQTMWRDEAFLEVNKAILHSFQKSKMTIVDHHSASRQFLTHDLREKKAGRECPGQWSWVVPPLGGTTCPVYHHEMRDFFLEPQYYYHADKWAIETESAFEESSWLSSEMTEESARVRILHASDDDRAEHYARMASRRLADLRPTVADLAEFEVETLSEGPTVILLLVSAFQDGDLPAAAQDFVKALQAKGDNELERLSFGIMVLGSSVYDDFGRPAEILGQELKRVGGQPMLPAADADELVGQRAAFDHWLRLVQRVLGLDATAALTEVEAPERRLALKEVGRQGADVRPEPHSGAWLRLIAKDAITGDGRRQRLIFDVGDSGLTYRQGDQLAIYPDQGADVARRVCRRLKTDPATLVTSRYSGVFGEELEDRPPFPSPISVERLFRDQIEVRWSEPFPELFRSLEALATDSQEKARLQDLNLALERGSLQDKRAMREQVLSIYPTVVDLLEAFPSARLKVKTLVKLLPKSRPGFFTISSSPRLTPTQIQVVFDHGTHGTVLDETLSELNVGDSLRVNVRPTEFHLPESANAPLLLIASGSGIATAAGMIGDLDARRQQGGAVPEQLSVLTLGAADGYAGQIQGWAGQGWVRHHHVDRVEEAIAALGDDLIPLLRHAESRVYLACDTLTADEAYDALIGALRTVGGMTYVEAVDCLQGLRSSGRLHRSVFSFTPGGRTLAEVRDAKYDQGSRWLRRYGASIDERPAVAAGG